MIIKTRQNKKTKFTRMCIAEAILLLLKETEYQKLRVSTIVKKAGVARMTFYKYYDSPYQALTDYLNIIITEYMEECPKTQSREIYMQYSHILYSLNFFDKYADVFLTLKKSNLYSVMVEGINQFMENYIRTTRALSVYELYSYAGGLLNTFIKWEESGKKESAEDIAAIITQLYQGHGVEDDHVLV